jgi:hypothetical protein
LKEPIGLSIEEPLNLLCENRGFLEDHCLLYVNGVSTSTAYSGGILTMNFSELAGAAGEGPTASATHACPERSGHFGITQQGPGVDLPEARYGPAFEKIECFDGKWWAHNEEYATEVTFCPWCGVRLNSDGYSTS